MFQSIKDALAKNETAPTASLYKEIMKFKPGNTYTIRLLPNMKALDKTFFHHYVHGWTSFSTGQYVSALSLQTFNERDPIAEDRYRLIRLGTGDEKQKAESVRRQEYWAVNVLVIDDPVNPENNGQVKIFRYGRQLHKIIDAAINGEDSSEFGPRVFDLSKEGCNFKVKAEKQGEYTVYTSSRFTSPMDLGLSESKIGEIYNKVHDLTGIAPAKSAQELTEMWNTHFYVKSTPTVTESVAPLKSTVTAPQAKIADDAPPFDMGTTSSSGGDLDIDDATVAELLKGLE